MDTTEILPYQTRTEFRQWLATHHDTARQCWIAAKRGKTPPAKGLYYLDAVEEALCFGWIDSTVRTVNGQSIQRFSPRKPRSGWTELNKERCRRLEKLGRMTEAGRSVLPEMDVAAFTIDPEIAEAFARHPTAWKHFLTFPKLYQRVRIDNIQREKRKSREQFDKRLARLIHMSEQGKMFGDWHDNGRLLDY